MDGFLPPKDASQRFSEEAAIAASSAPHHDGAHFRGEVSRDESAVIIPFARAVPVKTELSPAKPAAPVILVNVPTGTSIPDHGRGIIAQVIDGGVPEKNIALMPGEADEMVSGVLATLDLADLYRLSMGDPAVAHKTGTRIRDELDRAAVRRIAVLVLYAEGTRDLDDPIVQRRVSAIVTEIVKAAAAVGKPIIWPEPAETVANYYSKIPSAIVEELPHGTLTEYLLKGKLHRDPQEGPAREYRDGVRSWSEYWVDDVCHRPASEGPAFVFSHWEGRELSGEEYVEHGLRHRPASDGPALRCIDRAGHPVLETWCECGLRHRDAKDGPAFRGIENGHRIEEYYRHGKLHRDEREGPAMIARDPESGALHWQAYFHEGEPHRDNGPADTLFYPDGTIAEYWFCHGKLHRDPAEGPALIVRDADSAVIAQEFWVEGERIDMPESTEASP